MARIKNSLNICKSQVACDGADTHVGREICSRCEVKLRKRAKEAQQRATDIHDLPKDAQRRKCEIQQALSGDKE